MSDHSDNPKPQELLLDFTNFWKKVDKNGPIHPTKPELGNCWDWIGKIRKNGYGMAWNGATQKEMRAHRAAYFMLVGYTDLQCNHSCDRRRCVNPAHIVPGTQKWNNWDAVIKGRHITKLKEQDVFDILRLRAGGATLLELAQIFKVSLSAIAHICSGRNWRHLVGVTPP